MPPLCLIWIAINVGFVVFVEVAARIRERRRWHGKSRAYWQHQYKVPEQK